jgi:protein NrfD
MMHKTLKIVVLIVAAIGFVVGLYGLYLRVVDSHQSTNYGSYVPWGLWIAAYVMLVGTSAGAVGVAAFIYIMRRKDLYPLARMGVMAALAAFVAGMFLVWVDLGHADRFWKLYLQTSFGSVMGWMAWFYALYGILLLVGLWLTRSGQVPAVIEKYAWLIFLFVIAFAAAEGALFGVVGAQTAWESGFTPILFLVEGAALGVSVVAAAGYLLGYLTVDISKLFGSVLLALLAVVLLLEFSEIITGLYNATPVKTSSLQSMLFGQYWWVFWIFHGVFGVIVPIFLLLFAREKPLATAIAGALVVSMGLTSKLNLIVPALAQEEMEGLAEAFTGPGLTYSYVPSLAEWLVYIWAISLAVLVFLLGSQLLHIGSSEEVV